MRLLSLFVFLLFCVYALFARWYFVCEVRQLCGEEQQVEDVRSKDLKLTEGEKDILKGYDQFAFDSASVQPRLNSNNQAFLDTVAFILKANPNRNMTITAFYRDGEKDIKTGFFENIGLARADQIRKLLMKRGVEQSRISLEHGLSEATNLGKPLLFDLYDPNNIPSDFEKVVFTFKNMTFSDANFEFNSDAFKPGGPAKIYADSVKTYLSLNRDALLQIVGHTDSIASADYNLDLGMRRAQSAREYFRQLGVEAKITVESMGEERPVAPNSNPDGTDNPEGRQKNRRVNFILATSEEYEKQLEENKKILEDASDLN